MVTSMVPLVCRSMAALVFERRNFPFPAPIKSPAEMVRAPENTLPFAGDCVILMPPLRATIPPGTLIPMLPDDDPEIEIPFAAPRSAPSAEMVRDPEP